VSVAAPPATEAAVPLRRDPEGTRRRILQAALAEFAGRGFSGARIQSIARRAGVNARMLYHYFGEKEDLYRAIRRWRFAEHPVRPEADLQPLAAQMAGWFANAAANPDWVRLNEWESLEAGERPVVEEEERRRRWEVAVQRLRAQQAAGQLALDLDADLLMLVMVALTTFPTAFPPMVRMITGLSPGDRRFQRRYRAFLQRLTERLTP
jgi:AcrR family transcriptional regulator